VSGPVVSLLARAFDPARAVAVPDDATSSRILDAALAVIAASGVRHLTMDDVARRAGVGRMTVYRRFGDRERLVEALFVRECRRSLAALDAVAPVDAPVVEQVAAGFVVALRIARSHPLLNRLARVEPEALLSALREDGGAVLAMARAFLAARFRASQEAGVLDPARDPDALAELLVRLMLSFVLLEDTVLPLDDDAGARAVAERLLAPLLVG